MFRLFPPSPHRNVLTQCNVRNCLGAVSRVSPQTDETVHCNAPRFRRNYKQMPPSERYMLLPGPNEKKKQKKGLATRLLGRELGFRDRSRHSGPRPSAVRHRRPLPSAVRLRLRSLPLYRRSRSSPLRPPPPSATPTSAADASPDSVLRRRRPGSRPPPTRPRRPPCLRPPRPATPRP